MVYDDARTQDGPFRLGDWTVEPLLNRLRKGDRIVGLEPKVMRLLVCLAGQRGQVITRQVLLTEVWGGLSVVDGVMGRAVYQLRRRLAECEGCRADIETIRQVGFRLVCAEPVVVRATRRWGRIVRHPAMAWSGTALAASVAVVLAVHRPDAELVTRFVTVEIPTVEAAPVTQAAPVTTKTVAVKRRTPSITMPTPVVQSAPQTADAATAPAAPALERMYRYAGFSAPVPPPPPPPPAPPPPPPAPPAPPTPPMAPRPPAPMIIS